MALFKKKKKLDTNSMEKGVYLVTVAKPTSVDTEQFNTIRTNITFSSADTEYKSLMITSSVASEGKSTVAAILLHLLLSKVCLLYWSMLTYVGQQLLLPLVLLIQGD